MCRFIPALDSAYIVDGTRMELTPRQILEAAYGNSGNIRDKVAESASHDSGPIIDESTDPAVKGTFQEGEIYDYLRIISKHPEHVIPAFCPESKTRVQIASSLIDSIWKTGHFRLDDIALGLNWKWNPKPVGNMASFYASVESACSYLDMLGIRLFEYGYEEYDNDCHLDIARKTDSNGSYDLLQELPYRTSAPDIGKARKCPETIAGDKDNWLIYIPFDTCKFRLGGSLLSKCTGIPGGKAPDVDDSDYFIDCYEVVREFVEDGIILSGATAGIGGLIYALSKMTAGGKGMDVDIAGIMSSYGENDTVRILFGEIPGVVIEIHTNDFDYVDAELLLQDVAYYPIGHPGESGLRINRNSCPDIAGIVQALIGPQAAEGED